MSAARICATCKAIMQDGDMQNPTHGICRPCLKKQSRGGYRLSRVREIESAINTAEFEDGVKDINSFLFISHGGHFQ